MNILIESGLDKSINTLHHIGDYCMPKLKLIVHMFTSVIIIMILCGCGYYKDYDLKPDDELSQAVKDTFGDAFYYNGMEESPIFGHYYTFQINDYNPETIRQFVDLLNEQMSGTDEKVTVVVGIKQVEVLGDAFSVSNFSDTNLDHADYDGFYDLWIGYLMFNHDAFWDDVSIYSSLTEIRKLEVSDHLQEQADATGIDWYELFPNLEEVTVYDTSSWGNG